MEDIVLDNNLKNMILFPLNILYKINPKTELQVLFYLKKRYKLDLKNPITYNEKLNWMKLYYKNDLMPICSDKYTVRQYVKDQGCGEILNELYWEGFNPEDIPFDALPDKFVIKVSNGSGKNIICKNKRTLDREKTIKQLKKWLKQKYLPCYGEWYYNVIKPRIIIEKFLSNDNDKIPEDYKLFCFNNINGRHDVGITVVDTDRFNGHKRNIYDADWNFMPNAWISFPHDPENILPKPDQYEQMVEYAKKLSKPFPHARVDFYIVNGKIYFGELTLMNGAGFGRIRPREFDEKLGSWIKLPDKMV